MNKERVALVTGASSGIGQATALLLSNSGFRVFGTTRQSTASNASCGKIEMLSLDVRSEESVRSCVNKLLERAGKIDALVNNAGIALMGALEETGTEEAKAIFETNFFGVLRITQAVLPVMRKNGYGRIANISSVTGLLPAPYSGIYAASKHALEGYSGSLDHEVRQFGIRVSLIEPGFIRTGIGQRTQQTACLIEAYSAERDLAVASVAKSIANGEDPMVVAFVVLQALTTRSPCAHYLAGRAARAVQTMRKLLPSRLFDQGIRKQMGLS